MSNTIRSRDQRVTIRDHRQLAASESSTRGVDVNREDLESILNVKCADNIH